MYEKYIKRSLDILLSGLALCVLSPLLLALTLAVRISMGSPVLFRQTRTGRFGRPFELYKFRSMTSQTDSEGHLLPDAQRLTRLGRFLRSSSLDELPELFNILKGDMSIIGPRPLLPEYLPYYTSEELHRHDVRMGLIPPEVLYKDVMPTWENQFAYEVAYARHVTFRTDIRILWATVRGLFLRGRSDYGEYVRQPLTQERARRVQQPEEVVVNE